MTRPKGRGLWWPGLLLALYGCNSEPASMRLNNGIAIQLDWTRVGTNQGRNDRLLISADGYARRNRGGNLAALGPLTKNEISKLGRLRQDHASIHIDRHSPRHQEPPHAYRLRFSGNGSIKQDDAINAFAENVHRRLTKKVLLSKERLIVVAVRQGRAENGRVKLRVQKVLSKGTTKQGSPQANDWLYAALPDERAAAGGEASVFVLSSPLKPIEQGVWQALETIYLKIKPKQAEERLRALP